MSRAAIIEKLEKRQSKPDVGNFCVGDTIRIHIRIIEGEKERIQIFTGTVIARKGHGISETFSVHRVAYGEGMERVFLVHSPRISKIEVIKEGVVRRSKLYYLRGTSGKASKIKGRMGARRTGPKNSEKSTAKPVNSSSQSTNDTVFNETASADLEANGPNPIS